MPLPTPQPSELKIQRAEALTYLNQHAWVKMAMHIITNAHPNQDTKAQLERFAEQAYAHKDDHNYQAPTRQEWDKATELAHLFKLNEVVKGSGRRAYEDLGDRHQCALYIWKPTGFVDYRSANHSVLWACSCRCGRNDFVKTAHAIKRRAYYCGELDCPYRKAITQEDAQRRDHELETEGTTDIIGYTVGERALGDQTPSGISESYSPHTPFSERDSETLDMLINNIAGSASTGIH
mgnify:CR=1 FL=1